MYKITFYGHTSQENLIASIKTSNLDTVTVIILSGASVMVEWKDKDGNKRWGDAINGHAVTESLDCLLHRVPLPPYSSHHTDEGEVVIQ
jgi:hypothetical protein